MGLDAAFGVKLTIAEYLANARNKRFCVSHAIARIYLSSLLLRDVFWCAKASERFRHEVTEYAFTTVYTCGRLVSHINLTVQYHFFFNSRNSRRVCKSRLSFFGYFNLKAQHWIQLKHLAGVNFFKFINFVGKITTSFSLIGELLALFSFLIYLYLLVPAFDLKLFSDLSSKHLCISYCKGVLMKVICQSYIINITLRYPNRTYVIWYLQHQILTLGSRMLE